MAVVPFCVRHSPLRTTIRDVTGATFRFGVSQGVSTKAPASPWPILAHPCPFFEFTQRHSSCFVHRPLSLVWCPPPSSLIHPPDSFFSSPNQPFFALQVALSCLSKMRFTHSLMFSLSLSEHHGLPPCHSTFMWASIVPPTTPPIRLTCVSFFGVNPFLIVPWLSRALLFSLTGKSFHPHHLEVTPNWPLIHS